MLASKGGFRLAVKMTRLGKFPESKVAPGDKVYAVVHFKIYRPVMKHQLRVFFKTPRFVGVSSLG